MVKTKNKEQSTRDGIFGKWLGWAVRKMPTHRSLGPGWENGNSLQSSSGFTFIELMIVVAIIGILSGLFITQYPATQRRARDTQRRSDIKQYQTAMEYYANSHDGNYKVTSATSLSAYCTTNLNLATCPNDSDYDYRVYSDGSSYVLWARLEQPRSPVTYFVVCSDGRSGETSSEPSNSCTL